MIDTRNDNSPSRSDAHWRADGKNLTLTLTLYVKGRTRAVSVR